MARPPAAKDGQKTKEFRVAPGFSIGGYDGERKNGGDMIALTQKQAEYFLELGAITLKLADFDTEDDGDADKSDDKASKAVSKAVAKDEADGGGDKAAGSASGKKSL